MQANGDLLAPAHRSSLRSDIPPEPPMPRCLKTAAFALVVAACASPPAPQEPPVPTVAAKEAPMPKPAVVPFNPEAHLYLEDVEGEQALAWVRAQNQRSLALLEAEPRYQTFYNAALEVATSRERIPYGSIRNGWVYNFWQDDQHVRGVWRRVKLTDYGKADAAWETLLDIDALAKAENANWVYKGVDCLPPAYEKCLVSLSNGGKDAITIREFDLRTRSFVPGGFVIPEAKTDAAWVDADTLMVATDWGPDTLTESGYPFVVKLWKRGQPLAGAREMIRGEKTHVSTSPVIWENAAGQRWAGARKGETFFTASYFVYLGLDRRATRIKIPPKATPQGLHEGRLLVTLEQDWDGPVGAKGAPYRQGDLISIDWGDTLKDADNPASELVLRPAARQSIQDVSVSKDAVLVSMSDNVAGKVEVMRLDRGAWKTKPVALPANGSAAVMFADDAERQVFLGYESFLEPDTLYQFDPTTDRLTELRALPEWFNAGPYVAEQMEATSKDGTKVPYYVVRRKDIRFDGSNPTLLYAYGGFQISYPPSYSGVLGRLWLDQGGVYVLANIRGGGEFGPAWHQAGLKTKRQVIYDDFIGVASDIIARGITSPKKLGAMGGSNGGLLMGVMFTQRPDLFNAIVCQVPLLDMLRYHFLLAGASWVDEYGDPDVAEERVWLEKLSPYHNIDPAKTYPEIYFGTSTKDDRVHPAHARKMAKRLEELGRPFFYYENIDGGHSAAANQKEAARRAALEYTYLARKLMDGK
jgi:prolyl oligopeptidase